MAKMKKIIIKIPKVKVHEMIRNSDILVDSSFSEGFGLLPLEAMTVGCVPIVSNAMGNNEYCQQQTKRIDRYNSPYRSGALKFLLHSFNLFVYHLNKRINLCIYYTADRNKKFLNGKIRLPVLVDFRKSYNLVIGSFFIIIQIINH